MSWMVSGAQSGASICVVPRTGFGKTRTTGGAGGRVPMPVTVEETNTDLLALLVNVSGLAAVPCFCAKRACESSDSGQVGSPGESILRMRIVAPSTGRNGALVAPAVTVLVTLPYGIVFTLQVGFSYETWPVMARIPGAIVRSAVIPKAVWNAAVAQRIEAPATPFGTLAANVPRLVDSVLSALTETIDTPVTRFSPAPIILISTAWMVASPL